MDKIKHRQTFSRVAKAVSLVCVLLLFLWGAADMAIRLAASGRIYSVTTIAEAPKVRAALVLGCSRTTRLGTSNLYYKRRVRAVADLYAAGKVRAIIVSGDNHVAGYDEPSDMKEDIVAMGVPADRIVCDYAGFRTLDSVVRADRVFGLDKFIVVSQPFHLRRAIFIARCFGSDAYGYAAEDVPATYAAKTLLREQFAKVVALLDVIVRRQPKFLGRSESVPE